MRQDNEHLCLLCSRQKKLWKYCGFIVEWHHTLGVHADVFCERFDELLSHAQVSAAPHATATHAEILRGRRC